MELNAAGAKNDWLKTLNLHIDMVKSDSNLNLLPFGIVFVADTFEERVDELTHSIDARRQAGPASSLAFFAQTGASGSFAPF